MNEKKSPAVNGDEPRPGETQTTVNPTIAHRGPPHAVRGVVADNIPAELRERAQWRVWRWERRAKVVDGKLWDKAPRSVRTGRRANDENDLATVDDAMAAVESGRFDGVGFRLTADDPFACVDLDGCRDAETGELAPWAVYLVALLDSYTEVSPSGTGVKVYVKGTLPDDAWNDNRVGVEMWDSGRYLCVTGHHVDDTPATIEERADVLAEIQQSTPKVDGGAPAADEDDDTERARDALAGLSAARAQNYQDWLAVGMALHAVDDGLLSEWDRWSQQCPAKYQDGVCAKKWASFRAAGGLGLGSLIYWAKADGWAPSRNGRAPSDTGERAGVSPAKARARLRKRLGLNVAKLVQHGDGDAYDIVLADGTVIPIGDKRDVHNPRTVEAEIAARCTPLRHYFSRPQWQKLIVPALFALRERVETLSEEQELMGWLAEYVDRAASCKRVWEEEPGEERYALLKRFKDESWGGPRCIIDADGRCSIAPSNMRSWIDGMLGVRIDLRLLCAKLRRIGFERHRLSARDGENTTAAWLWRSQPGFTARLEDAR